uniref:Polypeptide N-acetylgalactosaminyltransferase n=1 Tax=Tetraselmis sp. GSL018 TaxID=582737 RepID=A0A061S451_9CHLO|eukprot:CAMPEP_0177596894 /NCGR_PEP_ID=MMETSP0419_2-20121207/11390_1 /TAXON_ID=582737 /ORGANISM="Tetraselmis sp., Strain GSL018" /LENGTH=804 /DNA_ID=CAMNT_0019088965 /DNA_START=100 /DNA_END=2514 /DNA_ORIENTATION=-
MEKIKLQKTPSMRGKKYILFLLRLGILSLLFLYFGNLLMAERWTTWEVKVVEPPVSRLAQVATFFSNLESKNLGACHNGLLANSSYCGLVDCMWSTKTNSIVSFVPYKVGGTVGMLRCANQRLPVKGQLPQRLGSPVEVSFVLPVHNSPVMAAEVLLELFLTASEAESAEFVVVNDGSSQDMTPLVRQIQFLKDFFGTRIAYISNTKRSGFSKACKKGVRAAVGQYIALINSDLYVTPGWLYSLLSTVKDGALVAGPLMLTSESLISEAGGIVFSDASAANYGRFQTLDHRHLYARTVDYISAACILFSKDTFTWLGEFDEQFGAGYYEDTDLGMRVKSSSGRVTYQPSSVVVHDEGKTLGDDSNPNKQALMAENKEKFYRKWITSALPQQCPPGTPLDVAARRARYPHMLWVDDIVPEPDRDSGSLRLFQILKSLVGDGFDVVFQGMTGRHDGLKYESRLRHVGVDVREVTGKLPPLRASDGRCLFNVVVIARRYIFARVIDAVESACPGVPVIFDTVDVHFLREIRMYLTDKGRERYSTEEAMRALNEDAGAQAIRQMMELELSFVRRSAATIVVSTAEHDIIKKLVPEANLHIVSNVHVPYDTPDALDCERRAEVLFVGNMNHDPNVDALRWWFSSVVPLLQSWGTEVMLNIVGANEYTKLLPVLQGTNASWYRFHGYTTAPELDKMHSRVKLLVAPLRFGAGVKGKVLEAVMHRLPVVATTIAAEGLSLRNGTDCLIADTAHDFASAVQRLLTDCGAWRKFSGASIHRISSLFAPGRAEASFMDLVRTLDLRQGVRRCKG